MKPEPHQIAVKESTRYEFHVELARRNYDFNITAVSRDEARKQLAEDLRAIAEKLCAP